MKPPATSATLLRDELQPDQRPRAGDVDRDGLARPPAAASIAGPVSATPSMCVWVVLM